MRKMVILGLMAATLMPGLATAQTHELRRDRADIREQQRDLRDAERRGDPRDIRREQRDLREARQEYRENWRDYRRDNRNEYRRPAYVGPRGYHYRQIQAGHRFAPAYYGRQYWVADPGRYRLPAAGGNRRWVRYGNDVALVNIRNGNVLEVHRNFFW